MARRDLPIGPEDEEVSGERRSVSRGASTPQPIPGLPPRVVGTTGEDTLVALLQSGRPTPSQRWELERALAFPWSWPGRALVAAVPELADWPEPSPSPPGETCLVSVTPDERAALWAVSPRPHPDARPLVDRAARAALSALRVASSHLPLVTTVRPLRAATRWSARLVAKVGSGSDRVLDGASFGLGFVLAAASLLLDAPVPVDVCALAAIDEGGRLVPVGALAEKLWMIAAWAPAVRAVLVAAPQAGRARELSQAASLGLEIVPVATVSAALAAVFPAAETEPELPRHDASTVRAALDDVYRIAVEGAPSVVDWTAIARAAARLGQHPVVTADPEARQEARVAEAIAWRHTGRPFAMAWPTGVLLERSPRPIRLRLLSHVVQSVADTPGAEVQRHVDAAFAHVAARGEEHAEDLELLGAIGRALASVDASAAAIEALTRAVEGWLAIWRADGAAHAVSELLRVHGMRQDGRSVGAALQRWVPPVLADARTGEISRGFVHLAAGRALASVGAHAQALAMLDPGFEWSQCPRHLQLSRLRWRAEALTRVGRRDEAHRVRRELALTGSGTPYPMLAALDLALADQDDPRPALAGLESLAPEVLMRWHVPGASPAELGRRVALRWRY